MPDRSEILRQRLQATFRIEAEEHLQAISELLDGLKREPGGVAGEKLEPLFRVMHTLKGAARSVGLAEIEALCHECETLLSDLTRRRREAGPDTLALIEDAADTVAALVAGGAPPDRFRRMMARLGGKPPAPPLAGPTAEAPPASVAPPEPDRRGEAAPPPPEPVPFPDPGPVPVARPVRAAPPPEIRPPEIHPPETPPLPVESQAAPSVHASGERIRVEVERLDRAMVLTEELLAPKLALAERLRTLRALALDIEGLRLDAGRDGEGKAGGIEGGLRDVARRLRGEIAALAGDQRSLAALLDELGQELRLARMMPAAAILESFPRMVRDICHETGKQADWEVAGGDLEVDRRVLGQIKDPLIHLVRNAIDHGIEPPEERLAKGKPARGGVALRIAPADGGRIEFRLSDDGRGFAIDPIRDAVVRARVMTAEQVAELSDERVRALAFQAGVSTTTVITNLSGRGLGLAIVQDRVERIGGALSTQSVPGQGTIIRIEVPASVATHRGLLVRIAGTSFLWAMEAVERVVRLPRAQALAALAQGLLAIDGESLPFGRLSSVLGLGGADREEGRRSHLACLIGRTAERRAALLVDEVAGAHEVMVKEFRPPVTRVRNIAAAGLLGSGELVLMLRPSDVLASAGQAEGAPETASYAEPQRVRRILVVDDSITTRTMERNLFEAAGYGVRTAADGLEAWETLQREEVDLVVSDVDMPKMDGFELTQRIRASRALAELPVVLVTALEAREDKDRGIQVGANAYVLKSGFDQSNLLEIVNRLI